MTWVASTKRELIELHFVDERLCADDLERRSRRRRRRAPAVRGSRRGPIETTLIPRRRSCFSSFWARSIAELGGVDELIDALSDPEPRAARPDQARRGDAPARHAQERVAAN